MREILALDLVHLHMSTRHFTFDAYGRTLDDAKAALARGWAEHCKQTGATHTLDELWAGGSVTVRKVKFGDCVRG